MGVYFNHQGIMKYLTGSKIAELLQLIAKACHLDWWKKRYCISLPILEECGLLSNFMKLGWTPTSTNLNFAGWEIPIDSILETHQLFNRNSLLHLNNHHSNLFHCTEIIVLHSLTMSLETITWALIKLNVKFICLFISFACLKGCRLTLGSWDEPQLQQISTLLVGRFL